ARRRSPAGRSRTPAGAAARNVHRVPRGPPTPPPRRSCGGPRPRRRTRSGCSPPPCGSPPASARAAPPAARGAPARTGPVRSPRSRHYLYFFFLSLTLSVWVEPVLPVGAQASATFSFTLPLRPSALSFFPLAFSLSFTSPAWELEALAVFMPLPVAVRPPAA